MSEPIPVSCTHPMERSGVTIDPQALIARATAAYEHAYARYSGYRVGAAVVADDGAIYTGSNIENAVYPLTICAERVAIFQAVSQGARRILALAVVTDNAGSPCGACRQVMREFGDDEMPVYIAGVNGACRVATLAGLLPDSFTVADLSDGDDQGAA